MSITISDANQDVFNANGVFSTSLTEFATNFDGSSVNAPGDFDGAFNRALAAFITSFVTIAPADITVRADGAGGAAAPMHGRRFQPFA